MSGAKGNNGSLDQYLCHILDTAWRVVSWDDFALDLFSVSGVAGEPGRVINAGERHSQQKRTSDTVCACLVSERLGCHNRVIGQDLN